MRIVRRDAADETERRLAPRLRVDLAARVTVSRAADGLAGVRNRCRRSLGVGLRGSRHDGIAGRYAHRHRPRARRDSGAVRGHGRAHVDERRRAERRGAVRPDADRDDATSQSVPRRPTPERRIAPATCAPWNYAEGSMSTPPTRCATRTSSARVRTPSFCSTHGASRFHGAQADCTQRCDFRVCVPEDEVAQDLAFLRGERVDCPHVVAVGRRGRTRLCSRRVCLRPPPRWSTGRSLTAATAERSECPARRCATPPGTRPHSSSSTRSRVRRSPDAGIDLHVAVVVDEHEDGGLREMTAQSDDDFRSARVRKEEVGDHDVGAYVERQCLAHAPGLRNDVEARADGSTARTLLRARSSCRRRRRPEWDLRPRSLRHPYRRDRCRPLFP